jgi:predicted permease
MAFGYRVLLAFYPRSFRRDRRDELMAAYAAALARERPRLGRVRLWSRLFADAIVAGTLMRLDERRRRGGRSPAHLSRGDSLMASLAQDLRYALRTARRAPVFTAVVVATLALAIGANTAIFSVVNAVLLRSLPFREPSRLVLLYESITRAKSGPIGFSAPDYVGLGPRAHSFDALAAFRNAEFELSGIDQPVRVPAAKISAGLFSVLGVQPVLGREFTEEEDRGAQPVAILSDALWKTRFAADPRVVGRSIQLDRRAFTIVGVMPASVTFPSPGPLLNNIPADVYVPISFSPRELGAFASMYNNSVVGRLRAGVTLEQAQRDVAAAIARIVADVYPAPFGRGGFSLTGSAVAFREEVVGGVRRLLLVLLAAVTAVLLVAAADIAGLMLTRAAVREREMAVRAALGASRGRLVRLVLVESAVFSVAGAVLGLLIAWWGGRTLIAWSPVRLPRGEAAGVDVRVLLFTLGLSVVTAIVCGLAPAWETSRRHAGASLKESGRTASIGARQRRIFATLVAAQFALAAMLLVAGGLLIRSFVRVIRTDPGFRAAQAIAIATNLPPATYATAPNVRAFYTRLLERTAALPAVVAVGASTDLPLSVRERRAFMIQAQPPATADIPHVVAADWVLGRYFDALGVRLRAGRFVSEVDTAQSEPVVVINHTMAQRYWPGENPVGRLIAWGGAEEHGPWLRIVGVVEDVKQGPLTSQTLPQTWQPWAQVPDSAIANSIFGVFRGLKLIVRTSAAPASLVPAIRAEVRALDPALPLSAVRTLDEVVAASAGPQRFNAQVLGGFAAVALVLASLGIAGVLATSISRRTHEIGIRMALGANRAGVLRMVLRQGLTLAIVGLAAGLAGALALARVLATLLYGVTPHDAVTFASVAALLVGVAAAACAVPALRAARVQPVEALRVE